MAATKYKRYQQYNGSNIGKTCKGPGCDRAAKARGMCNSHYYQERRGKTLTTIKTKEQEL